MEAEEKKIYFIDENEDTLDLMVNSALNSSMEENLIKYCKHLAFNFALNGVDIHNHPMEKKIYFIEAEDVGI